MLPEVLYDILTHPRYGCRFASERIDKEAFEAAAELIIDEDLGASPVVRERSNMRDVVGKLLTYMRGIAYYDGGKITLKLLREDESEEALELGADDFVEAPEPEPGDWEATWGQTRVTFTDAENNWERSVVAYTDPANIRVRGFVVPQDIEREWFTRSDVARAEAMLLGTLNGIPLASWSGLKLLPKHRSIRPGQLLKVVYPKLNIVAAYLRPEKVSVGGPDDPTVSIDAIEDPARQTILGYVGSELPGTVAGYNRSDLVAPTVRIATLTSEFKDGCADGLLVAISRPTGLSVRYETHFTWDPSAASYGRLASGTVFPIAGTILWWMRTDAGWVLRFRVAGSFDLTAMSAIAESFDDYYFVAGRCVVVTSPASDAHKLLCVLAKRRLGGRFAAIADDTFDIEVEAGQMGTVDLALETTGAGASVPTGAAYFGKLETFTILRSDTLAFDRNQGNDPSDTALRRYIKCLVGDDRSLLELADVTAVELKRADTTMDLDGSYSPTWGDRAKTAYEAFDDDPSDADVEDLNEALGRIYDGTDTADDEALLSDLDDVLGAYLANANGIYNDSP